MARKKAQPATEEPQQETAVAPPQSDGTVSGAKAQRRGQPTQTSVAFRDFAQNLGMQFTRTDNGEEGDAAALREFMGYGPHPWSLRSRTEYQTREDVVTTSRIILNALEDMEDYPDWREEYPLLHMPADYAFVFLVEEGMRSLHRASIFEALQFGTGIVAPDIMKSLAKKKD